MSLLQDWYPGDQTLEFFAIVALGAALLSTAAWAVARCLARNPAARHLVLLSALFGCLGMPALAAAFSMLGFTILSIPLLPPRPSGPDLSPTAAARLPVAAQQGPAADVLATLITGQLEAGGLPRSGEGTRGDAFPEKASAIPAPVPSARTRPEPQPDRALRPAGWPLVYRELAMLLLMGWGCGSALLLLRFAQSCLLIRGLRRSSHPLHDPSLHCLLAEAAHTLGIRQPPRAFVSHQATAPMAVGFRRSVIILPDRLIGAVTEVEMRDVLLHEAAHVRRRDPQVVFVQELARVLFWPIVPVHGLISELARAREELCDNHVLQSRDAVSYGETLLHLAELSLEARPMAAAVGILHWRGELERRIAGFLDQGRSTMTRSNRWLAGLVALTFLAGGAVTSATRLITANERPGGVPAAREAKPEPVPGRTMLVHVLGPDGRPMAGVKIHRSVWTRKRIPNANMNYVSDENGEARVDLPDGITIFRIWARAKHHVPLFAHWEEADVPERSLPAEFTFRLQQGTVIGGIVRNPDGQPIKSVSVDVMLQSGGQVEGRTSPDMWLSENETPVTDADGRWALDNVPPSLNLAVRLKFSHPDYISDREWGTSQDQQGVDLKALRSRQATIIMRGGLMATGTVTDPPGKPVAGAVVVRGDNPYLEVDSQEVRTDDHGQYRFPPLPAGPLNITVMAQGWMPALRKVEIGPGMKPFDFRLEPGKDLRIRFVDSTGKPVPGVGVGIAKWRGGESLYNHRHPNVLNTRIPVQADENGLYRWNWAPGDAVTYSFYKEGFARHEATLTAGASEQTVTLPQDLRISGKVTDAATGRPIPNVTAIPVAEPVPGRLFTERNGLKVFTDGTYTIEGDRHHADASYRVRIEAEGYRSAISEAVRPGTPNPTLDFHLEPASALEGRVVDTRGNPVKDARVYLATSSQILMNLENDNGLGSGQKMVTSADGRFSFPAQFERYAIVAVHDSGYAEVKLEPTQQPGDLTLRDWAKVEGRLFQAGQPVPSAWIYFRPVRLLGGNAPHIQDDLSVKTDQNGHFVFPRVAPLKASVQALHSVRLESPITSSQSVPLDLRPGEHVEVELGGKGTVVRGRVLLSGDAASKIDLHKSLNWLLRRAPGIEPPAELRSTGLTAREGWNNVWMSTSEGLAFMQTLHLTFVTLDKDGRFVISGVPAGDYDLALRLYEPPGEGCLVNPVGSRVVRLQISEDAARGAGVDLGDIAVNVALGPRVGDVVPDFAFADLAGKATKLSALRGRYVLLDFWATWCGPCVSNLPALSKIHERFGHGDRLTVLGLNLDDDPVMARQMVEREKLPWPQATLGSRAEDRDEVLAHYAISSVPTYILIGPDGKLIHRSEDLQVISQALQRAQR